MKCNCNLKKNMTDKDSYVRLAIAGSLMLYAFNIQSFILWTFAVLIFLSSYFYFCITYWLFGINKNQDVKNYYISLLPKHRTSPVFIFTDKGKIVYRNEPAAKDLNEIKKYCDLKKSKETTFIYQKDDKHYQVEIIERELEHLNLAYFSDVSEIFKLNNEIEDTQKEIIYAMGEIGETRSKETGNHVKRVALYSEKLAILYGLSYNESSILHMASPMHDIGKVGILDAILNKPGKLTKEEFEIMKTHSQIGFNMLNKSNKPILKAAAIVAGEHHEKWDGTGYPNGLKGKDIHIYGRITAIADVFDALGSDRVYKKSWDIERIYNLLEDEKGKHFDPELVDLFLNNKEIFLNIRNSFRDV